MVIAEHFFFFIIIFCVGAVAAALFYRVQYRRVSLFPAYAQCMFCAGGFPSGTGLPHLRHYFAG